MERLRDFSIATLTDHVTTTIEAAERNASTTDGLAGNEQGSKRLPLRVKATQTQQCYSRSARSQQVSLRAEPTGLSPRGANDLCVRGEDMHGSAQVRKEDWCLSAQVRGEDKHWSAQVWRRIHVNMYV